MELLSKYLRIEISRYGDFETEVSRQAMKAARTAACLKSTIWKNKHLGNEVKFRIYNYSNLTHINIYLRNQTWKLRNKKNNGNNENKSAAPNSWALMDTSGSEKEWGN